jgi:signal transduction histidine kinase
VVQGLKLIVSMEPFGNRDICIPDRKISSNHALLGPAGGGYRLRDLGSTNGTYVNAQLVDGLVDLTPGDEIRFGNTRVLYTDLGIDQLQGWPSAVDPTGESTEDDPYSEGLKTVKFRLHDVERELLSSEAGDPGTPMQRKLQVLHRMTTLTRAHTSDRQGALQDRTLLDRALALVFEVIDADRGAIFLTAQGGELEEVAKRSAPGKPPGQVSRSILGQVLEGGEAIVVRDAAQDRRFDANHSIHRMNIRSALAVPLCAKEDVLGVLHLDKREARRPFGEADLQLAVIVAQQLAAWLHAGRLFEQVKRANRELESARDEILRWNQQLERKVADRTREVEAQAAKIAELMRQKDRFLGMVAHDLRTPLAGLLGFAEVAIAGVEAGIGPARTSEDLQVIRQTALEMSELLNDLLDVSRLEEGKLRIEPRRVDLVALVRGQAGAFEVVAEQKGIALSVDLPEVEVPANCDPKRVKQILGNLVSNAVKFSAAGGRVGLRLTREPGRAVLAVTDTGQGIPPEDLGRIFVRYEQSRTQATAGEHGSGLGLAIAKTLVELHGGEIWVRSEPGVGSCFSFSLPMVD